MSFDSRERSVADGKPLALYEFNRKTIFWHYTNADRDITHGFLPDGVTPAVYEAITISDDGFAQSGDPSSDDFVITVPAGIPLLAGWRGTPPSDKLYLTLRKQHYGDAEAPVVWIGFITNVSQVSLVEYRVTLRVLSVSFEREGLRLTWQRGCPHFLYDEECGVNPAAWKVETTVTDLTGNAVTIADTGKPNGWFTGGYIEWSIADNVFERRPIESHDGLVLTLLSFTDGLEIGQGLTVYPGGDRTVAGCCDKFDNYDNYGGFELMPGSNPFDGNPVF